MTCLLLYWHWLLWRREMIVFTGLCLAVLVLGVAVLCRELEK